MNAILFVLLAVLVIVLFYRLLGFNKKDEYNRDAKGYDRRPQSYGKKEADGKPPRKPLFSFSFGKKEGARKGNFFSRMFTKPLPFDDESVDWCVHFFSVEKDTLVSILRYISVQYTHFKIKKRSGGYRTISVPGRDLLSIQKTLYKRVLLPVALHPAATGFRPNVSIRHNAEAHLGQRQVLKVDLADFFGSIKKHKVAKAFRKIGYPANIAKVFAELCTLAGKLPQGAPTSPALSNIIAYQTDIKLTALAQQYGLQYTRYADDLTFSGESIPFEAITEEIRIILQQEGFVMQRKKTRFLTEKKRKIITGISVSSGEKMTVPRARKREIRKEVHYVLTKGLAEHQRFIGSSDPSYLKRLIGYLHFWLMVEPDNAYVKSSIEALEKIPDNKSLSIR